MLCFCFAFYTRQESKSNVYKGTGLLFMTSYLLAGMAERLEVAPGRQSEHNLQQERGFQVFSSDGGRRSFSTSSGRVVDAVVDKNNCERTKRGGCCWLLGWLGLRLVQMVEYNTRAVGFGTR